MLTVDGVDGPFLRHRNVPCWRCRHRQCRANRHAESFLGDFEGTLLSDGYQAYAAWAAARGDVVVHAGCWAHARREIEAIKDHDPVRCTEALESIGELYAHEEEIRRKKLAGSAKFVWRRGAFGADR